MGATPAALGGPSTLIVVVNYRTAELTIACLSSLALESASVPGLRVVVVDNASGDDSAGRIQAAIRDSGWSDWAELLSSDRNLGFAGGTNLGIAHAEPADFVLLLNSDTIVHGGCLSRCLEVMDGNPQVGAMSCRVLNGDGSIQNVARRFPNPLRVTVAALGLPWRYPRVFGWADIEDLGWDRLATARDVDWLGGAFLLVRASIFEGHVRLDDDFFFYGEDIELCHRIHSRGFSMRYDPASSVTHLGGASSDPSRLPSGKQSTHRWNARYLVMRKCWGRGAELWIRTLDLTLTTFRLALAALRGERGRERRLELRAQLARIVRLGGTA